MVESDNLMVTVNCLVYNHEPFLRQCLDGFVMQKTTFKFEVIVHDDASTDRSADIIREYAERYPNIIRPVFEKENQYSKGVTRELLHIFFVPKCSSKYIAYCEGDDYWTDPLKLQTQVDFMERHPEYSICSHWYSIVERNKTITDPQPIYYRVPYENDGAIKYHEFTYFKGWFTQPLTCLYRNVKSLWEIPSEKYPFIVDTIFFYYVLKCGKGALLGKNMGVYRKHPGGIYSGASTLANCKRNVNDFYCMYEVEHERKILDLLVYNQIKCIKLYTNEHRYVAALKESILALHRLPFSRYRQFMASMYYDVLKRLKDI